MRSPCGLKVFLCLHAFGESFALLAERSSCISMPLSGFVGVDVEQSSCLNLFPEPCIFWSSLVLASGFRLRIDGRNFIDGIKAGWSGFAFVVKVNRNDDACAVSVLHIEESNLAGMRGFGA